jgi:Abnormal spindle-like microcephaly-assoc'd, ASPM-SPD-2-Hydin/PQQ-like domain
VRIWGNSRIRIHTARRVGLAATGLALVAGVLPVVGSVVPGTTGVALADDITASQNAMRTSWDSSEPNLSPTTVGTFSPAPRWNFPVDGAVYAQPLVIGSTVIVATESDWVYGINAGTGAQLWATRLGSAYPIASDPTFKGCTDLVPNIGVTGTPVYDATGTKDIFFYANIMNGNNPAYNLVQMNPTNGTVIKKIQITGKPSNDPNIGFSARYNMERPGVLILDGAVYGAFASHCDTKPYTGYVSRINISTGAATLWSDESGVTNNQAGIWQSGGGVMSDGSGRIFLTSGNGVSPPKSSTPGGQLAESVIRLAVNSNGTLSAKDFFSPANAPSLDASDTDYGAGGPVDVGNFTVAGDSTLAQIGKDGRIWLLNRNGLGGREQGPNSTDKDLFVGKAYGGEWGHPAVFGDTNATQANSGTTATDNDFLFSVGKDDVLRVFRFAVTAANKPWLTNVANSQLTYGFTSGSPVVTSNGDDPTSAVIWEVYTPSFKSSPDPTGANSVLEAYQLGSVASTGGTPSPCLSTNPCKLTNIWHSNTFTAAKFSIPATSQGWVYVGTRDGHVLAYAAPGAAAPAATTAATLPQTAVGSTSTQPVSVTAIKTVTITGATASTDATNGTAPATEFNAGQASVTKNGSSTPVPATFPVKLHKGDKLSVQTSFAPTVPGGSSGTLSLTTNSSTQPTVDVPLTAEGTQQGLYAQPSAQNFVWAPDWPVAVDVPIGGHKPEIVTISNLGTATQTVTSVTPPTAPFSATNLPAVGTKINPGDTIAVQVTYSPTSPGNATGSFTVVGSSGQKAVVALSAIATPAVSQLTAVGTATPSNIPNAHAPVGHAAAKTSLNFGSVSVGKKATAYIQVSNTGNTSTTLTGVGNPAAPFAAPLKPRVGLPFNPDGDLLLPVTFAPTKKGKFTTQYQLHWRDLAGRHTLIVTLTGTGV